MEEKKIFSDEQEEKGPENNVLVISFSNANHVGLVNFKNSISKHLGWTYKVIGMGTKWEGWMTRMKAYHSYLSRLPPDEIVVLSDAYDVLCINNGGLRFKELFLSLNKPIVIGAETGCSFNCFPPQKYWDEVKLNPNNKRRYVNGGLIAGYAGELAKMWAWCIERKFDDDQVGLGQFVNEFPSQVHLDIDSKLFFNDHRAQTNYAYLPETHTIILDNVPLAPFFIHFHGLNIDASVPFFNLFQTADGMFKPGANYMTVGKHINGKDHILAFPADKRGATLGVSIERGVCYGIVILLFLFVLLCGIVSCFRKKRH